MELFKKDEITDVQSRLNYAENPIQNEQDFSDSIRKTVFGGYDRKSVEQYIVSARSDMQRVIAQLEQQLRELTNEKADASRECDILRGQLNEVESGLDTIRAQLQSDQESMKNMKDTMGRYQADNEEYRQNLSVAKEELAKQQEMLARYKEEQQNRESYEQQLREQEERMEELNEKLKRYRAERDELQEKADSLERRLQEEPRHIERELVVQKPVPENSDRPAEDEAVSKDVDVKDDMPVWLDDLKDVILQNAEKEEKKEAPVPRKEEERTVSARSSRDAESSFRQPVSQTETDTVKNGAEELSGKLRMAEAEKFRMKRQAEEREAELAVLSEKLKKQLESNQILSEEIDKLYADYSKSESRRKILEEDSEQKKFLLKFYMEKNEENLLLKNDLKKKSDTVKALKKALEQVMNQMKAQTDNIKVYSERAIRESEQHSKAMAELAQMKIRGVELLDQVNMLSEKNRQMKEENENLQRELTELRQKSTELGAESKVLSMKAPRNMMEETGFEKELQKCTEAYEQAKEIIRAAL